MYRAFYNIQKVRVIQQKKNMYVWIAFIFLKYLFDLLLYICSNNNIHISMS